MGSTVAIVAVFSVGCSGFLMVVLIRCIKQLQGCGNIVSGQTTPYYLARLGFKRGLLESTEEKICFICRNKC